MDYSWLLVAAILVFFMQAGFLCLESGKIRAKNSINVAAKNISDFLISANIFWIFGFALMFGDSVNGFWGSTNFFFGNDNSPFEISFFIFQMMFCGTATTLMSGAVAERMSFIGYICAAAILSAFIYPICGHWAWASIYSNGNMGWLEKIGFVDFAGATVVHVVGGCVAFAAVIIIGPRMGRFNSKVQLPAGNNLPMSVLGTMLIWLGWFGFNGGSTLAMNDQVPSIILNTSLAATWGGVVSASIYFYYHRYFNISSIINGVIAGLVSITACCHAVSALESSFIGMVAGVVLYASTIWIAKMEIDDALDVIPAHLFAGIWGTLAVALFADLSILDTGLDRWHQFGAQLTGIVSIALYSFGLSYILLKLVNKFRPLRVSEMDEMRGMNISEHRASSELIDLLGSMHAQQLNGDFSTPVPEEPFTEVGQIANEYNQVIQRVNIEITKRDDAINDFRSSEKRKNAILDSSMDSILTIDLMGKIIEFNKAAEKTFGYLKKNIKDKNFIDLFVLEKDKEDIRNSLKYKFASSQGLLRNQRNAISLKRSTGGQFPAEIAITCANLNDEVENEFTFHIRDITRQIKLQDKLQKLAYSDPLTGMYNRTYLMQSLLTALESSNQSREDVVLFFLDLDRFKKINDTLGHKAGDELLCEMSKRLVAVTRESDIIARWGGDEFVLLMSGIFMNDDIRAKAREISNVLHAPIMLEGRILNIMVSIGISVATLGESDAAELLQQADIAMYYAKKKGRDNIQVFAPELAKSSVRNFNYEQDMRKALNANEQFSLVYQPKVLTNKKLVGLEALMRWQHPVDGQISPSEFIPIAEESDLIIQMSEKVIQDVLQQLKQWQDKGKIIVPVSVNISGKHLVSEQFVPFIKEQLSTFKLNGSFLEIEITEGVLLSDIEECIQVMSELKKLHITISIDDFGTGYSSLNYLKRLPIDVLKIDRSFIDECNSTNEDGQICSTIINLANGLDLITVAEGVETVEQLIFLVNKGCKIFQGYYFYRPLLAEKVEALLE